MSRSVPLACNVRVAYTAIAVAAMLILSGCATSTNDTASTDPIVIFQTNSFSGKVSNKPQTRIGAQAAVNEINDAGGINGRKLKLVSCDNTGDPNVTNTCVKQAKDANAAAFVGSAIYFPATWKLLDEAKIPYLLGTGLSPDEYSAAVSFPLSGQAGWYYGIVAYLKKLGATKPAIIRCEIAACEYGETLMQNALTAAGEPAAKHVIAPLATTDYSPFAASALDGGTDAVVVTGSAATATAQAKAVRQQGFKGIIVSVSACVSTGELAGLGEAGENLYIVGLTQSPTLDNARSEAFKASMDKVDDSAKKDELAFGAYAGVKLFAAVAKGLSTVTAETVLQALSTAKVGAYDIGIIAPVPGAASSPLANLPKLAFSPTVTYNVIKDGKIIEEQAGFQNPFTAS